LEILPGGIVGTEWPFWQMYPFFCEQGAFHHSEPIMFFRTPQLKPGCVVGNP